MAPASGPPRPPSQPAPQSRGGRSVAPLQGFSSWAEGGRKGQKKAKAPVVGRGGEVASGWGQKAHSILDQVPFSCPPAFFLPRAQPSVATAPPPPRWCDDFIC